MNRHLHEFDSIRTAAALSVIAIHITAGYMDLNLGYVLNHLVRFAVPLFIIISGFVLCWNDRLSSPLPAGKFYMRRLHKILWPYFIWSVLYSMLNARILHVYDSRLFMHTLFTDLLWGSACYHLYFVIIILQLYLLYPWLRIWLAKDSKSLLGISFIVSGIMQVVLYLYLQHIIILPAQYSMIYLRFFPVWIFYFVLGMFGAVYFKQETPIFNRTLTLGLAWLSSFGLMLWDSIHTRIYVSIVRPSVMLYATISYYFFLSLTRWGDWRKHTGVKWLSSQSYLIYLMHPMVITLLTILARKTGCLNLWNGNLGLVLFYLATVALTVTLTFIIEHSPVAGLLGGVSSHSNRTLK